MSYVISGYVRVVVRLAILFAMLLVGLGSLVRGSTSNKLVRERGLVTCPLDLYT